MRFFKTGLMFMVLLILLLCVGNVFSTDINDLNSTIENADSNNEILKINTDDLSKENSNENNSIFQATGEIEVETWDDIQYYSSLNDDNYVLKLKENTNYYPADPESVDCQIIFNNNVTIIGAEGAYFGDTSPNARNISYTAMKVSENSGNGITFKGITFKWIGTRYQPDGVFCEMGGNAVNYIEDCYFTNISTNLGHSSILHIKLGDAVVTNCTFINCTTDFGCISVYNPNDDPTKTCILARMNVSDSYFEGNYARTEPGCINNCGILVVRNSTFHKNSAFWWAGGIHTHGGANTTLYDCIFTDNLAGWNGGALYTYSYLQIYNTIFIGNNCTTNNGGGAIGACKYLHAPYIIIRDSLFKDNANNCWGLDELSTSGTGRGGAISLMDQGLLDVRNTTFIKNSASIGTAICAINGGLQMGSPDVIIVGNRFINHTRVGDVLDVRLASGSYLEIDDNYYYNNSFEFKKLRLVSDEKIGDDVVVHIDAELKNPNSFERDILDTTSYDIYVDGVYNKTVIGRTFTLNLKNGKTCNVYAVPSISNSVTNEIFVGVPKEYVYVSQKSGKDTNNGLTRTSPVKTVAKAIELARTKGNIIIMDGSYSESNLTVDYNLTITGENGVKFSGNIPLEVQTIFTVRNADLSLSGITFDSLIFAASTTYKNKKVIQHDGGYLTIDGCTFTKISPNGNTGMNIIESSNIEIYNSVFANNNKASVYITPIKANEFLVDNCNFTNNAAYATTYAALISTVGTKTGVKGTVTNSLFENNKVKHGCIFFGSSGKPITITNTKFIANTVGGNSDHSSCIKIEESPTLRVDSVIFKDNINFGTRAAVIYVSGGSSSVFVSNSIIINNSFENNNNVVFSASTANNLKAYKNLNGNWWGNTLENSTTPPKVYASACNSWLVMNITANVTDLAYNQNALVSVDFNNAVDRQGNSSFADAFKLPNFDLNAVANNGVASASKIGVINGRSEVEYTLKSYDSGSLTLSYADVESSIDFNWGLVNPEIEINVENNTYGNPTDITINVPNDVDTGKFSLKINNNPYSFSNAITIPKLNAGDYLINLTYSGDAKYRPYTITKQFKIKKATPQLTIDVNDVYYPNSVKITVNAGDATGQISIKAGDKTDSKAISSGKAEFIIAGLQANNYTAEATYSGDTNYISGSATAGFKVKKYSSTITVSHGNIAVGSDVTLTFNVNSDASGTVTVDINGEKNTVPVSGGKATYTIRSISRGLYDIVATYNGDAKYLSSQNTTQLDVARLTPDLNAAVSSVTYGQDAVFTLTLNNDASGSVTVTVEGKNKTAKVTNGRATLNISDISAGNNKNALIQYSGDNNYKPKETSKTFNVAKAKPLITIDVADIKEGQISNVQITITRGTTGTIELVTPDGTENPQVPRTGLFTRTFSDLAISQYTISVNYGGDSNFLSASASKTFGVSAWSVPQWPNEGYDVKNTGKSPYVSESNGNVAWVKDIDATIIGNMAIDSLGNIYITTSNGIYSINGNDGSTKWIFSSQDAGTDFSGIAIGRDTVLAPKSGDKLYFINQTTGEQYHNNIYQGSSLFAPIVDDNGNIYTSGEYYEYDSTNLVVIPYKIWQTSTAPISIGIGSYNITSSPVLVDKNTVFLKTANGLISIDLSSKLLNFNRQIAIDSNLVVGIGNITYFITNGHVKGYDVQGIEMYDVAITGTAGNYLSVGVNGEIFSINKEGKLFEYSTGQESLIYDFKEPVSSRLLVGQDDKLYVGSSSGMFYAIDVEGNLLWQVNLNRSISNSPVMDKNGVIYVVSGNRIVAIDKIDLKDSQLSAEINNIYYKEDVKVDITITSQATGVISIKVGDVYTNQTSIGNGQISFTIPNLNVGNYTAKISYAGDSRYESKELNVPFRVLKLNPTMDVNANHINVGEVLNVTVVDLPMDATGVVQITVGSLFNSSTISNGQANLLINGLTKGEYPYTVTYLGDANYNSKSISKSVAVGYIPTSFNAATGNINVGQDCVIKVTGLPNDANGFAYVTFNNKNYAEQVKSGSANVIIPNLPYGSYNFEVRYINDTKYSANPQIVSFKVSKITPTFTATVNDINVGDNLIVDVSGLPDDATGLIIASIEIISKNSSVGNGNAHVIIPQNLADGTYSVNITYSGDNKYNAINTVKSVKISKKTPSYSVSISNIYVGDNLIVDVEGMPTDCEGTLTASISGFSNSSNIKNGISTIIISEKLANGTYPVEITYSGDAKYDGFKTTKNVIISKKTVEMSVKAKDNIIIGENLTITVSDLPVDGSRYVYILGEIQAQGEIINGVSNIVISDLTAGKYSYNIYYPDDERYIGKTIGKTVKVDKITPQLTVNASNVKNIDDDLTIIVSNLPSDGVDYIIISGDYEGIITIINGTAKAVVPGLTKGSYSFNIQYPGSDKYNEVTRNLVVDVGKVDVNYTVKCGDVSYGNPAIFEISGLPSDATGLMTVIINHNEYSNKVSNGKTSINVLNLSVNKYDAEIRYSNDEIYMADPKVISFNVTKANPTINVVAENIKYGEDLVVNINLNKDASGILNVTVGDILKTVYVVNGAASATFSDLNANNHTINVYYGGDENYNSISTSRSITVSKINPEISVKADNIKYGENLTVRISLPKDATGNVTVKVDGKSQTVEIDRGNAIAVISGLTAGKKSVSVSYSGDKKYNLNSYSTSAIVDKITPIITISADNIKYGESAKISVKISENISGNIVVSAGEISKTVKAIDGSASAELFGLSAGSHLITAKFNGDSIYNEISASKTITVSKIAPDLTVNANDIKYGEDLVIDVNLNNDCSGNVVISVGDVSKTITLKNGVASVKFSNLPAGDNNIIVKYDGDDNYYSDSASKQISVSKIDTPIIILADDIKYGENLVVKVNLNKDAKGNVIVSVDDIHQSINIINGSATATISSLTSGDKVINVRYLGDEKYNYCTASKNITVSKATSLITVPIDVKITDNSRAEISMNNVSCNVSVIVDGEEIIVPLNEDGKASVDLKGLSSGNHSIIVVYDGDDTYAPSHNSSSFNVPQTGIVPIASEFRDITVNDDLTISFVLKDKNGNVIANAPVSYTIDGVVSSKNTDSEGSFAVPSKDGVAISINYDGNGTFRGTDLKFMFNGHNVPVVLNIASRFNIPNRVITINGYAVDAKAGEEGIYYSTNLLDAEGNPIKGSNINFAVNNKIYNRTTDEKGDFSPYKLNMIRAGRYTMAFYFAGDDSHTPAFACVCVDLDKKPVSIKAFDKTFKASATKKYKVSLSTIVGSSHDGKAHLSPKKVTLTVNGKTYSATTNKEGQATFNIKITKKGTYTAKISYEGDSIYNSATKSVKLTIK